MELTKDDITAMKSCDRVMIYLRKHEEHPRASGATAKMRLIQEMPADVFQARERVRIFETTGSLPGWAANASAHIYCGKFNRQHGSWAALTLLVRPGDELTFWATENNNQYVEACVIPPNKMEEHAHGYDRIHHDEMFVSVRRKGKTLIEELCLCCSMVPDNTARMLQA